jgi:hypothetical protein
VSENPVTRRQTERVDARTSVTVVAGGTEHRLFSRNVSIGGVFVEAQLELPFDTVVEIRLDLDRDLVVVKGRVRWVEKTPEGVTGLGIQFDGLPPKDVWALNRYLAQVKKR